MAKRKTGFALKEVHDHMQCGCQMVTKVQDSATKTVRAIRCECTITDGNKYATNKKGGKTWHFGGIAMGEDPSL